jgi:hypothetical protein
LLYTIAENELMDDFVGSFGNFGVFGGGRGAVGSVRLEIHAVRGERKRVRMRTGVAESI